MGWLSALLRLFGFGAQIAAKNQDVINSPEVVRGKIAKQDAAELDKIQNDTQKGDIESARNNFNH